MHADWVPPLGGWLLTYLVHSTLLLGTAWIVTRRGRLGMARRELVWRVALLGGLASATAQVALVGGSLGFAVRLAPAAAPVVIPRPTATPAEAPTVLPSVPARIKAPETSQRADQWTGLLGPEPAPVTSATSTEDVEPDAQVTAPASHDWLRLAVLGWLGAGGILVLLYLVQRARAFRRIGPRGPVRDAALVGMLEVLRRRAGIRRAIRLTAAPGLGSPVALGRDEIVLPEAALSELDGEQQESLLAHELAHLVRRDPAWLALTCLVERLFFLQPLNHLARRELQDAAEYLCDDWAVNRTGSGFSLARCLVKVAEWVDARPATVPLAGMAERPSQLVSRVHRLLEGRAMPATPRSLWFFAAAVTLVGLTAVAAPGITAAAQVERPSHAEDASDAIAPAVADVAEELQAVADTDDTVAARTRRMLRQLELGARTQSARVMSRAYAPLLRATTLAAAGPLRPGRAPVAALAPSAISAPHLPPVALAEVRALSRYRQSERGNSRGDTTGIAVPALMTALKDPDVEVRRAAAQSLSNFEDRRAVPALIEALKDSDAEVRATCAMALGQLEDPRAAAPLAALLKDNNVEVRRAALYALHEMPGAVSDEAILSALNDADAEVREAALGVAFSRLNDHEDAEGERRPDPRFVTAFTKLLSDRSTEVRHQAAMALGSAGLREAPAPLIAAAKDRSPEVRQAVASALGEIGDARAVPTLKELLADGNAEVRECAIQALSEIRDQSALEALVGALKSNDPTVRRYAAEALGARGGDE